MGYELLGWVVERVQQVSKSYGIPLEEVTEVAVQLRDYHKQPALQFRAELTTPGHPFVSFIVILEGKKGKKK